MRIIAALLMCVLTGCAALKMPEEEVSRPLDWNAQPQSEIEAAIKYSVDPYYSTKTISGPTILARRGKMLASDTLDINLGGIVDTGKGKVKTYFLSIYAYYDASNWRFYQNIVFPGADVREPDSPPNRDVSCHSTAICAYTESLVFAISPQDMIPGMQNGLHFRLDAKNTRGTELYISPAYVKAVVTRTQAELDKGAN